THTHSLTLQRTTPTPPKSPPFPYTTLFRSEPARRELRQHLLREALVADVTLLGGPDVELDPVVAQDPALRLDDPRHRVAQGPARSEEHTSELQSRGHLVCRLLLDKKKERVV